MAEETQDVMPTVELVRKSGNRDTFRLTGGAIDPAWVAHFGPSREAWCEIAVYDRRWVGVFGGEVWPAAWPNLFSHAEPTAQFPVSIELTPAGRALLYGTEVQ